MEDIDFEALRRYLMDYFGTAVPIFPIALVDVTEVEYASDEELIEIALRNNIDLGMFTYQKNR